MNLPCSRWRYDRADGMFQQRPQVSAQPVKIEREVRLEWRDGKRNDTLQALAKFFRLHPSVIPKSDAGFKPGFRSESALRRSAPVPGAAKSAAGRHQNRSAHGFAAASCARVRAHSAGISRCPRLQLPLKFVMARTHARGI